MFYPQEAAQCNFHYLLIQKGQCKKINFSNLAKKEEKEGKQRGREK